MAAEWGPILQVSQFIIWEERGREGGSGGAGRGEERRAKEPSIQ